MFRSFIRKHWIAVVLLAMVLLYGCRSEEAAYHADCKTFLRLMRTVEIGPMNFSSMTANDVLNELVSAGNKALVDARSPFGVSFMAMYPGYVKNEQCDWDIPRMPILSAMEHVCQSCGFTIKYKSGLFFINFNDEEGGTACKGPKDDEEPREEECMRRDELMRTVEIGPEDLSDMSALDAVDELYELGDDALKQAGWGSGLEIVCGGYGKSEQINKRDWHIPRSTILKACEHLCRSCGAEMEYTNGVVNIIFRNTDSVSGEAIDGREIDSDK